MAKDSSLLGSYATPEEKGNSATREILRKEKRPNPSEDLHVQAHHTVLLGQLHL